MKIWSYFVYDQETSIEDAHDNAYSSWCPESAYRSREAAEMALFGTLRAMAEQLDEPGPAELSWQDQHRGDQLRWYAYDDVTESHVVLFEMELEGL